MWLIRKIEIFSTVSQCGAIVDDVVQTLDFGEEMHGLNAAGFGAIANYGTPSRGFTRRPWNFPPHIRNHPVTSPIRVL
jgi:hypothetical protein